MGETNQRGAWQRGGGEDAFASVGGREEDPVARKRCGRVDGFFFFFWDCRLFGFLCFVDEVPLLQFFFLFLELRHCPPIIYFYFFEKDSDFFGL